MSRLSGQTSVATNADILMNSPFDTRSWTPYYSGLTDGTIPQPYKGMLVSVYDDNDSNKNGLYFCTDIGGPGVVTTSSTIWEKLGSGAGTLTGGTISTDNKISGGTISGYTIYFGQVNASTGGTYSNGTISLSGTGSLGTITGFEVLSGTGVDVSYVNANNNYGLKIDATNQIISFRLNNGTTLSASTGSLKDYYVTAGTYNNTSGIITFYNTSGSSFPVSGFTTGNNNYYTTGSTYNPTNGVITFNRTDLQPAYSATGFNYVTGFTVSSNRISGYTNISGASVVYGGTINAVTGGSFSNNILYLSGTGSILSGVSITGFSTTLGEYLPLSGGTVTGGTRFQSGLTANTISATTYFNLPISGLTNGTGIGISGSNGNYTISYTGSTGISGNYLPISGGTLTGGTIFQSGLTANTISATTYYNLPVSGLTNGTSIGISGLNGNYRISYTGNTITGGTLNLTGGSINFSGTSSGFTVTGFTYVTGFTVNSNNTISGYTNISGASVAYGGTINAVTGATYNATGRTLSLSGTGSLSSGVTVSGQFDYYGLKELYLNPTNFLLSATTFGGVVVTANTTPLSVDNYVTGGTYNISAGTITFRSVSGTPFPVSGFTTGLTTTTGATYYPSQGTIEFTKTGTAPAYSAIGFNYITGITVSSSTNAISGYTNISGTTAAFGGILTAVTGGTYTGGTLYLSGTGLISTGITISGFNNNQSNAVLSGGVNNYLAKWTGSTALTVSQIYDNGTNVGIGLSGVTNKLHISASTNPIRIEGIQQSAQTQTTSKFLMIDDSGTVFWNNVTPTTGISIYLSARTNSGQVDFIPTGTSANYRSVNYNYQLRRTANQTIRSGTLQAVWSSGATGGVNYTDMGPLQFLEVGDSINYIAVSGVTGGITVDISVSNGNWEFKAYKVLL